MSGGNGSISIETGFDGNGGGIISVQVTADDSEEHAPYLVTVYSPQLIGIETGSDMAAGYGLLTLMVAAPDKRSAIKAAVIEVGKLLERDMFECELKSIKKVGPEQAMSLVKILQTAFD